MIIDLCTSLSFSSIKAKPTTYLARNLSEKNLEEISFRIASIDFSFLDNCADAEFAWLNFKSLLLNIIDSVAPIKSVSLKKKEIFPWIDDNLVYDAYVCICNYDLNNF